MAAACLTRYGAAYGALNKSSEGGLLLRSTSATPLQQLEGFKREATIVSAELDDEAAVIISCPREGGGGPVQSRRRAPDDKYSPHSQTRLLTRPAVLWCVAWDASAAEMSRPGRTLRLGLLSGLGRRRTRTQRDSAHPAAPRSQGVHQTGSRES